MTHLEPMPILCPQTLAIAVVTFVHSGMHFCVNLCALHTLWFWLHVLGRNDPTTLWRCMLVLPQDTTNCASTTALFAGSLLATLWCGWHLGCHHFCCRLCAQRVVCLVCAWFVSISWPGPDSAQVHVPVPSFFCFCG